MEHEAIINDRKFRKRQIDHNKTRNWTISDWHRGVPCGIPFSKPHLKDSAKYERRTCIYKSI